MMAPVMVSGRTPLAPLIDENDDDDDDEKLRRPFAPRCLLDVEKDMRGSTSGFLRSSSWYRGEPCLMGGLKG